VNCGSVEAIKTKARDLRCCSPDTTGADRGRRTVCSRRKILAYRAKQKRTAMNRNVLYLIIGALAVATVVLGYQFYQERQKTTGIEIDVGKSGISIEKK
jgi:hypothetical protein